MIMSQWLKHRDERHFAQAEVFRPERWFEPATAALPRFAYFPFGGGPRVCIGSSFATMEGTLVLATIFQRFRITCAPKYQVDPWPSITLQPRGGINLQLAEL